MEVTNNIKSIDAQQLKEKIEQNERFLLVDCREQEEWNEAHIKEAVLIPLSEFEERRTEIPTNIPVVLICRSGRRSLHAAHFLGQMGYADLTNVEDGMLGWIQSGFAVEQGQ